MNLDSFIEDGFIDMGSFLDPLDCSKLSNQVFAMRDFSKSLFIDEETHRQNPRWQKNNPGPGINLAEKVNLDFIEKHPEFQDAMTKVLGNNYKIMLKKFIVGMPEEWIPTWIQNETKNWPVGNLGPFMKPEFQDLTYFRGIDFHQDLIDHKSRKSDFITLYVYLDDIDSGMSPLVVVPKSHIFGGTVFPHDLKLLDKKTLEYSDRKGHSQKFNYKLLTGKTGSVYFWSALTLHATQHQTSPKPRLSLRYLIERGSDAEECLIDKLNEQTHGPLELEITQEDRDETGQVIKKGNIVNQIQFN